MGAPALARAGLVAAAATLLSAACARPAPPPGGTPDRQPPRVVSTRPEQGAVVPGFEGRAEIRFDERLSEQGFEDAVTVSPATGPWEAHRGGDEISVEMKNGWRAGVIYRVVVQPTIQDLFHNKVRAPIELVFSTGPTIPPTVLGGVVVDRLTEKPAESARVEAVHLPDSLTYVAMTDAQGVWVMRHLPPGDYLVRAYLDQNRSRGLDAFEPRDSARHTVTAADTALLRLAMLPNDSTPATVVRAEALDSVDVQVTLDDFLDPADSLSSVTAQVWHLPDSTRVAVVAVLQDWQLQQRQAAAEATAAAARDSAAQRAARDTGRSRADTLGGRRDTTGAAAAAPVPAVRPAPLPVPGAAGPSARPGQTGPGGTPLPSPHVIVVVDAPLQPGATYRVTVGGVTNISGLRGGGGSALFRGPQPPAAPADTTGAARDTSGARADTSDAAPADTRGLPPRDRWPARAGSRQPPERRR